MARQRSLRRRWLRSARHCARRGCARGSTSARSRRSTKIRAKYLRAIENEEWDLLPGAGLRQELPADLRRLSRARQPAADRRVQAPLRAPDRPRAATDRAAAPRARARAPSGPLVPPWVLDRRGARRSSSSRCTSSAWRSIGEPGNDRRHRPPTAPQSITRTRARTTSTTTTTHGDRHHAGDAPTLATVSARPDRRGVRLRRSNGHGKALDPGRASITPARRSRRETSSKLLLTLGNNSVTMGPTASRTGRALVGRDRPRGARRPASRPLAGGQAGPVLTVHRRPLSSPDGRGRAPGSW